MEINIGDIFWVTSKGLINHPHVVIQIDIKSNKLVVCSITTNRNKFNIPGNVLLDIGEGGLKLQSIVEVGKTFNINKSQVKGFIGRLNKSRVNEIIQGIGFIDRSFLNSKD